MQTLMHAKQYIWLHLHVSMHKHAHAHAQRVHAHVHVQAHVSMHVSMHEPMSASIHARAHACVLVNTKVAIGAVHNSRVPTSKACYNLGVVNLYFLMSESL